MKVRLIDQTQRGMPDKVHHDVSIRPVVGDLIVYGNLVLQVTIVRIDYEDDEILVWCDTAGKNIDRR